MEGQLQVSERHRKLETGRGDKSSRVSQFESPMCRTSGDPWWMEGNGCAGVGIRAKKQPRNIRPEMHSHAAVSDGSSRDFIHVNDQQQHLGNNKQAIECVRRLPSHDTVSEAS